MFKQIIDRNYAIKEILVDDFQILHTGEIITTKGQKVPTEEEIQTKLKELQADYDSKQYQRDRLTEYPSIQDVVVALAEKEEGDDTMWQEISVQRAKVKKDYPKP